MGEPELSRPRFGMLLAVRKASFLMLPVNSKEGPRAPPDSSNSGSSASTYEGSNDRFGFARRLTTRDLTLGSPCRPGSRTAGSNHPLNPSSCRDARVPSTGTPCPKTSGMVTMSCRPAFKASRTVLASCSLFHAVRPGHASNSFVQSLEMAWRLCVKI